MYVSLCILNAMNTSNGLMIAMLLAPLTYYLYGKKIVDVTTSSEKLVIILGVIAFVFSLE